MKRYKFDYILALLLSLFFAVFALDFAKQQFIGKKDYKIVLKDGAIIEGNFSNGLIAYQNINITIYKWEISDIKEKL